MLPTFTETCSLPLITECNRWELACHVSIVMVELRAAGRTKEQNKNNKRREVKDFRRCLDTMTVRCAVLAVARRGLRTHRRVGSPYCNRNCCISIAHTQLLSPHTTKPRSASNVHRIRGCPHKPTSRDRQRLHQPTRISPSAHFCLTRLFL